MFLSAEQYVFAQRRPSTNQWSIYSFSCFSTTYTLQFQRQFVAQTIGNLQYIRTQTSLLSGGTATGCKSTYTTQQLLRALFAAQYNSVPLRVVSLMRFWIIAGRFWVLSIQSCNYGCSNSIQVVSSELLTTAFLLNHAQPASNVGG